MKAIIFDCFGVLTIDAWLAFIGSLPPGVDVGAVREVHRAYTAGLITKEENTARIHELAGQTFPELEDMPEGTMTKNTALVEYIAQLKQQGYKIGLLSNVASSWIRDSFLSPQEQKLFDDMVFSFEVGIIKPDPRIFHLACERLGVELSEAVLVDDIEHYCTAARGQGMQAIQYKDLKQLQAELKILLSKK